MARAILMKSQLGGSVLSCDRQSTGKESRQTLQAELSDQWATNSCTQVRVINSLVAWRHELHGTANYTLLLLLSMVVLMLTLRHPLLPYGYSYKASCAGPG